MKTISERIADFTLELTFEQIPANVIGYGKLLLMDTFGVAMANLEAEHAQAIRRVVTENGTFTKDQVSAPVLITSFGQSADVSMLDALMKKVGAEYTFDATASAEDAAGYKTIIIASGASSKGLGAAGISQEDEIARAEAIAQTAKDNDITVIVAHMGGAARRGTLSDQFSDLALGCADYIMVVEEGNDDGKFSDAATDAGIPITMLYTIADAVTPLQEIFGA